MAKKKSTVPSGKAAQSISSANKARMIEHCLLNISTNMEVLKANNNGKLPYGAISRAVHDVEELVPWVTTQKVKYFLRKMRSSGGTSTSMDKQPEEDVHEESQESEISMLTMEGVENYSYSRKNHHHSSITTMIMSASSSLPPASTTTASTESSSTISATTTLPYGGRPKGTTAVASSIMAEKVKECISNSAAEYMRVREEEKEKGGGESRVKRNTLACIILREKEALGIPPAVNINFETVRTRAKRKKSRNKHSSHLTYA